MDSAAALIGYMPMPLDFKYRDVFLKGRPQHEKYSDFWRKHPPMSALHWAKIFAPFDALVGFDEAVASKRVQYCEQRRLSQDEHDRLDRELGLLHSLTYNSRAARLNRPVASVTYFVPCGDVHSEWYGVGGRYETVTGTVQKIDAAVEHVMILDGQSIPLDAISEITERKTENEHL